MSTDGVNDHLVIAISCCICRRDKITKYILICGYLIFSVYVRYENK